MQRRGARTVGWRGLEVRARATGPARRVTRLRTCGSCVTGDHRQPERERLHPARVHVRRRPVVRLDAPRPDGHAVVVQRGLPVGGGVDGLVAGGRLPAQLRRGRRGTGAGGAVEVVAVRHAHVTRVHDRIGTGRVAVEALDDELSGRPLQTRVALGSHAPAGRRGGCGRRVVRPGSARHECGGGQGERSGDHHRDRDARRRDAPSTRRGRWDLDRGEVRQLGRREALRRGGDRTRHRRLRTRHRRGLPPVLRRRGRDVQEHADQVERPVVPAAGARPRARRHLLDRLGALVSKVLSAKQLPSVSVVTPC